MSEAGVANASFIDDESFQSIKPDLEDESIRMGEIIKEHRISVRFTETIKEDEILDTVTNPEDRKASVGSIRFETIDSNADTDHTYLTIPERRNYSSFKSKSRSTIKRARQATKEIISPEFQLEFKKELDLITQKIASLDTKPVASKPTKKPFCSSCSLQNLNESQYLSLTFYKNNADFFGVIAVYCLMSLMFVLIQLLVLYPTVPWYVKMARAAGILLNFNSCLVILLVLRRLNSWIRNTVIGSHFSVLDEFIHFHKFIGVLIFILSVIHTIGQSINAYYLSIQYEGEKDLGNYGEVLFGTASKVGWVGAGAFTTGWICLFVITIIFFFAMPFIRRKGYFQLFYVTHWLHYVYYIVMIFHATHFWKWFIGPAVLVIFERVYNRFRINSQRFGETYIKDVNLLSSKVTHLVITRPKNFKFQSGDYMYIKIPKIARNEWHPFTISSAPELKDEIWVHIRSLGNWTDKLNEYFSNFNLVLEMNKLYFSNEHDIGINLKNVSRINTKPKIEKKQSNFDLTSSGVKTQEGNKSTVEKKLSKNLNIQNKISNVWVDVRLDGPYGTASRRIFDSEHAVMIAGGIGVTPFASILQSLWFQYMNSLKTCKKCNHQWYDQFEQKTLKKVDFIWVNRDFEAFEWFIELLGEIELQQSQLTNDPFIQIHLYMTSAKVQQEIKLLDRHKIADLNSKNLLKEIIDEKNQDFSLKLSPGRPKLQEIFTQIRSENKGKVDAFFCGAPLFGSQIKKKCTQFKFNFSQENF